MYRYRRLYSTITYNLSVIVPQKGLQDKINATFNAVYSGIHVTLTLVPRREVHHKRAIHELRVANYQEHALVSRQMQIRVLFFPFVFTVFKGFCSI